MSKEVLNKKSKLVPIPTDRSIGERLLRALPWGIGALVFSIGFCVAFMNVLSDFGEEVGFTWWLAALNIGCFLVAYIPAFVMASEGSYKRVEDK